MLLLAWWQAQEVGLDFDAGMAGTGPGDDGVCKGCVGCVRSLYSLYIPTSLCTKRTCNWHSFYKTLELVVFSTVHCMWSSVVAVNYIHLYCLRLNTSDLLVTYPAVFADEYMVLHT